MNLRYSNKTQRNFLIGISAVFIFLTLFVLKDILVLIIYSAILSYFLYPVYEYLSKKFKNKRISSLSTILISVIVIFLPFIYLSYIIILELAKIVIKYREYIENPEILNAVVNSFLYNISNSTFLSSIDVSTYVNKLVIFVIELSNNFFSSIPATLLKLFIVLFITYYILIYNREIFRAVNEYIPLSLKKQDEIVRSIAKNIKVLFKGYFLTGLIQTLIAFAGYVFFGAPNILIITCLTLITTLIPYLGTPLVWVPISIYMIISGNQFGGYGLLIYGTLIINMVDNFIRPILMSNKDTISPALVFIGFVGGIFAFGIIGIILGPLIISITSILLKYLKESLKYYEEEK